MARFRAKFGLKHEKAIAALMTQRNVEEAARVAGIGKRTLYRWQQEPEFQDAYREAKQAAVSQSMARLQYASSAAASTLLKLIVDPSTPASVKARVADSILNHAVKATEMEAIEARAQTAESDMDSPTGLRVEQSILLGIVKDTVLSHRERMGNPADVTPVKPCHQESDRFRAFFQDCCLVVAEGDVDSWKNERCWVPVAELYPTYAAWAATTGDRHPLPKGLFEERLHQLGREKGRVRPAGRRETKQVWVWLGIRFDTAGTISGCRVTKATRVTTF
ncbi:MAG: hypothetical protein ABSH49_35495 [Bryobacteraceae bacterium]|jgi:hypothetical protein